MIYLLHISDLHLVANPLWNNMKHAILLSVKEKVKNIPTGEKLLVITGDLHNFIEKNYNQAKEFLPQLFQAMEIEPDKDVFIIPGNHDIANTIPNEIDRETIIQAVQSKPDMLHDRVGKLLSCYQPYIELVKSIGIYKDDCEKLPVSVHVRTWRDKLHLLHLNTSIISNGETHQKQMTDIKTATSDEILGKLQSPALPCIALGHHSFFDLVDEHMNALSGIFLNGNISAYLCGDRHQKNNKREGNKITLSSGFSAISIPNIISYRTSTDENDLYSDFGMIWHILDERKGHVDLEFMKWDSNFQGELQPDGNSGYDFRNDIRKFENPSIIKKEIKKEIKTETKNSLKKDIDSCWSDNDYLLEKGSIPVKESCIRSFLHGGRCGWNLVFGKSIVERNIVNTLYENALEGGVYALTGPGGEGKSTALMQLYAKLIGSGESVFYYRKRGKIELPENFTETSILIMDNPPDSMAFKRFLDNIIESGYTLIIGVRENEWNLLKKSLQISERDIQNIPMQTLTPKEAWEFANCVCDNNIRKNEDRKEIKEIFRTRSYGFLYAAMLMVVNKKNSLEDIAHQIIEKLSKQSPKALLLLAHIVMSERFDVKFESRQFKIVCGILKISPKDGNRALCREVSLNGDVYQTRHETISKLFFEELFSESGILDIDDIDNILTNLLECKFKYYQSAYGKRERDIRDSIMSLSGGLAYTSLNVQKYLIDRILDEFKTKSPKQFSKLPLYLNDEDVQLQFYRISFDREWFCPSYLWNWCNLLLKNGMSWTDDLPYSPRWIMRETCINNKAESSTWHDWAQLEAQYGDIGDYDIKYTARWIYRELCLKNYANSIAWHQWGRLEVLQDNIGDYNIENSARWIFRKACLSYDADGGVWREWGQLEENQGNVGSYYKENSARWIFRKACLSYNVDSSVWRAWGQLEENQGNVGNYSIKNSARWIYREVCVSRNAGNIVWKVWGQLEEKQGNIGDYNEENSARWIFRKGCISNNVDDGIWREWGRLEEKQGNIGDYDKENSARWIFREGCVLHDADNGAWREWGQMEERQGNIGDYDKENSARWIFREGCVLHNADNGAWREWGQMEERQGNIGDYDKENSARWIFHEACILHYAGRDTWLAWGQLEERQGNIGSYDKENSARWIFREACISHNAGNDIWLAWGQLEEQQGNIGSYDKENSARWIFREACISHKISDSMWLAWGQLEEQQGNIGRYDKENSARWIFREACISHNARNDTWLAWGQLEEKQGNIGSYDKENSARWIFREACISHNARNDTWLAWGQLEEKQGNIGGYDKENSARWIFREACISHKISDSIWLAWGQLEEKQGNIGSYDKENSARWIFREACISHNNLSSSIWLAWGQLEEQQGNIGSYDKENSARWIFREACITHNSGNDIWLAWGQLEEQQGNIGSYDKENSARWIFREACISHNNLSSIWLAWGQLEEQQENIGSYDKENSARWIFREACITHNSGNDIWLEWEQLEEQRGNIGSYEKENSARWIFRETCLKHNVDSSIWAAWGQLEVRQGNIGDFGIENSARWIFNESIKRFSNNSLLYSLFADLEITQYNIGQCRKLLREAFKYSDYYIGKLAIFEYFYGNINSGDDCCVRKLMSRMYEKKDTSIYAVLNLYYCHTLLGETEDAEYYNNILQQHPDYCTLNNNIEEFIKKCRKVFNVEKI